MENKRTQYRFVLALFGALVLFGPEFPVKLLVEEKIEVRRYVNIADKLLLPEDQQNSVQSQFIMMSELSINLKHWIQNDITYLKFSDILRKLFLKVSSIN